MWSKKERLRVMRSLSAVGAVKTNLESLNLKFWTSKGATDLNLMMILIIMRGGDIIGGEGMITGTETEEMMSNWTSQSLIVSPKELILLNDF